MTGGIEKNSLERVFGITGCHTQNELAELLGIKQSSISDAKKRNAIPAEWLIKLLRLKNINPEWVLSGIEPKYLGPASGEDPPPEIVYVKEIRPPSNCPAQELVNELVRRAMRAMKE